MGTTMDLADRAAMRMRDKAGTDLRTLVSMQVFHILWLGYA